MYTLEEVFFDFRGASELPDSHETTIYSRNNDGETPLHLMTTLGLEDGVVLLLDAGADINAIDNNGNTSLHEAISEFRHLIVPILVERGADIHIRNNQGESSLDLAKEHPFFATRLHLLKR